MRPGYTVHVPITANIVVMDLRSEGLISPTKSILMFHTYDRHEINDMYIRVHYFRFIVSFHLFIHSDIHTPIHCDYSRIKSTWHH